MRFPDPGVCSAERRMALELHGLHRDDRDWLLAALPPEVVERVSPLLEELGALGLPPALRIAPALKMSRTRHGPSTGRRERIAMATGQEIAAILRAEPLALSGWLLALGPWPWQSCWMRRLEPAEQAQVLEASQAPVSPRLGDALLDALSDRLATAGTPGAHGVRRWKERLGWKP